MKIIRSWSPITKLVWVDIVTAMVLSVLVWTMCVTPLPIAGVMMTVASVLVKIVGSPDQIGKLLKATKLNGHSIRYWQATLVSYVFWVTWGFRTHDYYTVVAQSLGVVGAMIVVHLLMRLKLKQRPMTFFDHPAGPVCEICAAECTSEEESADSQVWILDWPKQCYSCPDGNYMHITDREVALEAVEAICETCRRLRKFNVGPTSRPEYWHRASFWLCPIINRTLDTSAARSVSLPVFMATLLDSIRIVEATGAFHYDGKFAHGVPHSTYMIPGDWRYAYIVTEQGTLPKDVPLHGDASKDSQPTLAIAAGQARD